MEVCDGCHKPFSASFLKNGVCAFCAMSKNDTIEKLRARIAELELELKRQKTVAEKGDKLIKVMWGDDFNDDSLH